MAPDNRNKLSIRTILSPRAHQQHFSILAKTLLLHSWNKSEITNTYRDNAQNSTNDFR